MIKNFRNIKKSFILIIIVIFIFTSLTSAHSGLKFELKNYNTPIKNKTGYMDEDWDIIVPDDYPTIQEAIDNSIEYNRIFVRNGFYFENINVNVNAIQIIGENKSSTIIDGGDGTVVNIQSFLVNIFGFTLQNGNIGLTFSELIPTFNTIIGNNFCNNDIGVITQGIARSNYLYHNNFINNSLNAYDEFDNTKWYDPVLMEGNYWDDYNGTDNNGDGIGDTPYAIPGNHTQDLYPLINPWMADNEPPKKPMITGPKNGKIGDFCKFIFNTTDPEMDKISYYINWGDGNLSDKLGPYLSGENCEISYKWDSKGRYLIRIKAIDTSGAESKWSDPLTIHIGRSRYRLEILNSINNLLINLIKFFPILKIIYIK